jgi:hypothetical protein
MTANFSGAYVKPLRLGEGSAGRAASLHLIPRHLLTTEEKSRMASTGLLFPAALGFGVR